MRQGIDIAELESETKIRAKYLRALENEEWSLLPGPTFVKSFLRTYADALGLDGRLLLEEYKLRNEGLSDVELQPIVPAGTRDRRPIRRVGAPGRVALLAIPVAALVVGLYLLGSGGGGSGNSGATASVPTVTAAAPATTKTTPARKHAKPAPAPSRVRLSLVPTGTVYACLEGDGKVLIAGKTLVAGPPTTTFRAKRFKVALGNGQVGMRVNGKLLPVPNSSAAIGYALTRNGRTRLPAGQLPTCGA